MALDLKELFSNAGVNAEGFAKIKIGQGFVGKTSYVAIAAIIFIGAIGFAIDIAWMQFLVVIIIAVIFAWYFWLAKKFAENNPALALLEGAELLQYKRMEYAAKGVPNPSIENVVIDSIREEVEK